MNINAIKNKTLKIIHCLIRQGKSIPWRVIFRMVNVAISAVSAFIILMIQSAISDSPSRSNTYYEQDQEGEGHDVFDGESFGKGSLYVDHSTGEESPTQLSGFKRV